ncbi:MAG: alpha/beta fold hydrolase [Chloroflexi bacterium]|nr:alpha/beta fold hydrolase [Chloroflexota bacterium]MCI0645368.1 alpha/beta fold hydrolase [Chloroflexota bacterium]MCI0727201.1 alpha/beta fold hydrolase [Chloroflexota bacterium]
MSIYAQQVAEQLVAFTNHTILMDVSSGIDADTPILDMGILDSLSMVSLLTHIQTRFGVRIPDEEITPDNFETLRVLAELTVSRQGTGTALTKRESALLEAVRLLETSGIERQATTLSPGEEMHTLRVAGDKPTWVLLPGLGNPSSSWGPILQSLQDENEAIAVDFAGFGLSHTQKERPTFHDHVEATMALLEKTATAPFVLVGSSAGAMVATEIARRRPEWVRALVVTGFGLIADTDSWWQRLMTLSDSPEQFMQAAYYHPPHLTEALRELIDDVLNRPAYRSFLEGGGFAAMKTTFDGLTVPTLFVAGENDGIIPAAAVLAAAEAAPQAKVEWLARCGHFPPAEQPQELIYVIRNFLRRVS